MLSTHGGIRAADGTPIALGYHTGHWEVGLLLEAAAGCVQDGWRDSVCGGVHGSVRRPIAGHHRDVRQPAVPERCGHDLPPADPFAAHQARRARRRDLRQRLAGDDDGARGEPLSARRAGAGRGHVDAGGRRGRRKDSNARRPVRARQHHARGGLGSRVPRVRIAGRRVPVSGYGRDRTGGRGGARHVAGAFGASALRTSDLDRHGAPVGDRADGARSKGNQDLPTS